MKVLEESDWPMARSKFCKQMFTKHNLMPFLFLRHTPHAYCLQSINASVLQNFSIEYGGHTGKVSNQLWFIPVTVYTEFSLASILERQDSHRRSVLSLASHTYTYNRINPLSASSSAPTRNTVMYVYGLKCFIRQWLMGTLHSSGSTEMNMCLESQSYSIL